MNGGYSESLHDDSTIDSRSVRLQKDIAKEMQIVDAIFDEMLSNNDEVNVYDDRNRGNEESRRILTNPSQQRCDFADEMQKTDGICDGQRPKNEKQDTAVGHRTITDSGRTDEQESLISGNDFDVRLTADVHASSEHAGNTETCYDGDSSSGKSVDLMREHVKLLNELAVTNEMMSSLCTDLQSIAKCWNDSERTVAAVVKKSAAMMTASNPPYVDVNRDNESCGAGNYQCCCSTADQSDTSSSDPSFYAANRDFGRVTTTDDEDDRFYAVDDVQTKPRYRSSRATVCGEATRDTRQNVTRCRPTTGTGPSTTRCRSRLSGRVDEFAYTTSVDGPRRSSSQEELVVFDDENTSSVQEELRRDYATDADVVKLRGRLHFEDLS